MGKKKPIVSSLGQWAYPGEVTIIPSNSITMKGVGYPVLGVDNLGNSRMMMPGADYIFPGDYVTEIPQMGKGGLTQWFAEEWTDVKTGKPCGRSGKEKGSRPYPACRPKKRVNETTPKTTSEMSSAEKARFKREKTSGKRIDYNHKRREFGGETGWLDNYQDGGNLDPEFMFKNKYNTELTPSEEKQFSKWAAKESQRQGRDILNDMGAYDIKGFWKSGDYKKMDSDNHGTDTWKKPNHPTFSNQSRYHGADGWYGGNWTDKGGYQPSKQTLETYGPEYYDWLFKSEPGRSEYLDMSRYESGLNKPTPFVYQKGGWLEQYQEGGESDIRMEPIQINTQQSPWYIRYPRKALRAIDNKLTDWGAQYSKRISDATGGKDWYKEANPFGSLALEFMNAPQYTATYGVTGKVQTPSEAMDIQNPYGAFAVDAITDPMNLVGAGVTRVPQYVSNVGNSLLKKGVRAGLQSPRLSFAALQRRFPSSFEDVSISPGLEKRDLITPSTNQQANLVKFMQGLSEEAPLIRQSLNRRIADLESPEGYKRLVNQEQEALLASGVDPSVAERVAKLQAKSRIEELKNTEIINESAVDYLNRPSFTADNPLVYEDFLYTNAYYLRPVDEMLSNLPKQPGSISLSKSAPINYAKPNPGTIGVGYNLKNAVPIHMHEIAHALQRGRSLPIDQELITTIKPRKKLNPVDKSQYNYFIGDDKLEPTAFANELREALLQKNFIQNTYDEITPEILSTAQKYFKKNPLGLYSPNDAGSFWSQTRILDFMEPSQSNFQNLSKIMNKLPAVAPIGIGAAGVAQLPEQKYGGWLNKYK